MIKIETITINGRTFVRTYSDANRMIKQDGTGAVYAEAYDPADSGRTYTETEEEIATEANSEDYKTAFEIITGEIETETTLSGGEVNG